MKQLFIKNRPIFITMKGLLVLFHTSLLCSCTESGIAPLKYARIAAERIARDAVFEAERMPQKGYDCPTVVDCATYNDTTRYGIDIPASAAPSTAWGTILAGADSTYLIGFTSTRDGGVFPYVLGYLYLYIPLLTMGLMSREFSSGSIKLLYSSPVRASQIVAGKFLSVMVYGAVLMGVICIWFMLSE